MRNRLKSGGDENAGLLYQYTMTRSRPHTSMQLYRPCTTWLAF